MALAANSVNGVKIWRTPMSSLLGWVATAVSAGSYFSRQEARLRKIQGAAACLWIIYGLNIDATPMIVANIIVAAMAFCSSFAARSAWKEQWSARLRRRSGQMEPSDVADRSHPNASYTAMVVPAKLPVGVTERASDLVMFGGTPCDRVRPENVDIPS
jgi:hypothetical protein